MGKTSTTEIWDPLVRVFHWLLVASVFAAWWTRHGFGRIHEWVGYVPLGLVVLRLAWGFLGPRHARFSQFVRSPGHTVRYGRDLVRGDAARYLGHNPLGGWMTVVLLCMVILVSGSGWLYTTDRFWGVEWVENLHDGLTNALIGLVGLHLAGVAWSSFKNRENLVASMIHGRKRAAEGRDIDD